MGLPMLVLVQVPTSPPGQHPSSGHLGVGPLTPAPLQTLGPAQAKDAVLLYPSYAAILVVTAARAAGRPYIHHSRNGLKIFAQCPKLGGGYQSLGRRDWLKGESGGKHKASDRHNPLVVVMRMPLRLHYTPNQLWATIVQAPAAGRHGQASCLLRWVTR